MQRGNRLLACDPRCGQVDAKADEQQQQGRQGFMQPLQAQSGQCTGSRAGKQQDGSRSAAQPLCQGLPFAAATCEPGKGKQDTGTAHHHQEAQERRDFQCRIDPKEGHARHQHGCPQDAGPVFDEKTREALPALLEHRGCWRLGGCSTGAQRRRAGIRCRVHHRSSDRLGLHQVGGNFHRNIGQTGKIRHRDSNRRKRYDSRRSNGCDRSADRGSVGNRPGSARFQQRQSGLQRCQRGLMPLRILFKRSDAATTPNRRDDQPDWKPDIDKQEK